MKIKNKKFFVILVIAAIAYICRETLRVNQVNGFVGLLKNSVALENLNNVIQIICGIFVIIGTFIAVWQYSLSVNDSHENREREYQLHKKEVFEMEKDRVQKAIDLAGYYKDYIVHDYAILKTIYTEMGVSDILNKINFCNIEHFDTDELNRYVSNADIKKIESIADDPKLVEVLTVISDACGTWRECKEVVTIEKDNKVSKQVKVSANAIINSFQGMQRGILNNIEYFAMHFTHGTADESVVYQSLHTTYLEIVEALYYDIASNNTGSEKKLFTNVVELYNIWNKEARKQKDSEVAAAREHVSKGKTLQNY